MSTLPDVYPPPTPGGGYALRTVVVVDDLNDLHGPIEGKVRLPLHLDASDRASTISATSIGVSSSTSSCFSRLVAQRT